MFVENISKMESRFKEDFTSNSDYFSERLYRWKKKMSILLCYAYDTEKQKISASNPLN